MTFEELMSCHEKNQGIFDSLCIQMDRNNVIPFIGSGMSAWIYPTWSKLLTDIAYRIWNCTGNWQNAYCR